MSMTAMQKTPVTDLIRRWRVPLFYSDIYHVPLPTHHRFPMQKYRHVRSLVERWGAVSFSTMYASPFATRDTLIRVHEPQYVDRFLTGNMLPQEERAHGFPWSPELVHRSLSSCGGAIEATRSLLRIVDQLTSIQGDEKNVSDVMAFTAHRGLIAGSLAGGTHHAYRSFGSGYCSFNDIACSIEIARHEFPHLVQRALVIDTDVHQGDGTASIFQDDPSIFTFSIHAQKCFPFRKQKSDLDIGLEDGADDGKFLGALDKALTDIYARFRPDIVFFQAGVDPLKEDQLGRLHMTRDGLQRRNRLVFQRTRRFDRTIPIIFTMGGGYARPIERSIECHADVVWNALEYSYHPDSIEPHIFRQGKYTLSNHSVEVQNSLLEERSKPLEPIEK